VNESAADWIFKVGSALGGIVSIFGGIVARDLYSRLGRLETSHDLIITAIASSNKELTEKLHTQEIKFSEIMHKEMGGAVLAMESLKDMARSTFHTKEEHQRMSGQLNQLLDMTRKELSNRIDSLQIAIALLDTDQARTARLNAQIINPI
jgi:hypothetical protein